MIPTRYGMLRKCITEHFALGAAAARLAGKTGTGGPLEPYPRRSGIGVASWHCLCIC